MSGWKQGSKRYHQVHELFKEIWRKLQDDGDVDFDGKISEDEWVIYIVASIASRRG